MNLMDLFIKIGVDDQASGKMSEISSGMIAKGQLIADAISSAVQFAGEKIIDFGKQAIEGYANYEQLVGGVETLFKESAGQVQQYASEAYKTAGLSANEYMETVTSFSASLLQATGRSAQTNLEELEGYLEAEYEATKEAYNAEYDVQKEAFDAEYKAQKEAFDAQYDAQKAAYDAQYKALKESQEAELKAYTEQADAIISSIDKENKEVIAIKKQQKKDTIAAMKEENKKELEALKENQTASLKALKDGNKKALEEQKKANSDSLKLLKESNSDMLKAQKAGIADAVNAAEEANMVSVTTLESQAEAAELANQAIIDMSDNANKMGTDMAMIQNAYQGFAKANYTMLDNLKLGYGGTQAEMQRLVADAAKLSDTVDEQSLAFDNVVKAIHVVQTELGITGTTAKEAGSTISGSISSMKSAWENLVVGIADENANLDKLFYDLVTSIVGDGSDANKGVLGNLLPRIEQVFKGIGNLGDIVRPHLQAAASSVLLYLSEEFASGDALTALADSASKVLMGLAEAIPGTIDTIAGVGLDIINGISNFISNEASLDKFLGSAGAVLQSLVDGLAEKGPDLITGATQIVTDLVTYILDPENLEKILKSGGDILGKLAEGIGAAIPKLAKNAEEIGLAIEDAIMMTDWLEVGKSIFDSVIKGFAKGMGMKGTAFDDFYQEEQQKQERKNQYYYVDENGKIVFDESAYAQSEEQRKQAAQAKISSIMGGGVTDIFDSAFGGGEATFNINVDGDTIASVTYDRYKNIIAQKGG